MFEDNEANNPPQNVVEQGANEDAQDDQNPFLQNQDQEEPSKKKTGRRFAIKPEDLAMPGGALDQLYLQSVIFGKKQGKLKLQGKGHEASDLDKIMNMYRGWHREIAPKFEFSYFAERLSKFSNSKDVKEHMEKLRGVYKGEVDHFMPFGNMPDG